MLATVVVLFGFSINTFAQTSKNTQYPYYIENFDITAKLNLDNTIDIKQNISVYYNQSRQGVILSVPAFATIWQEVNGQDKRFEYTVKVDNVVVDAPFETTKENNLLLIKIGKEGVYNTGKKQYTVSYTLDMGEDRLDTKDFFYYSFIGTDWDCPIENVNIDLSLPKEYTKENLRIFSGELGSTSTAEVDLSLQDSSVKISTKAPLKAWQGLTVQLDLPQGYFVGTSKVSSLPFYIFGVVCFLALIFLIFLVSKAIKTKQIVKTVEFYAPQGMLSAELGYVMDGSVEDTDILSLIPSLAHKGYLEIETQEDKTYLSKTSKPISDLPKYAQTFYNAIFAQSYKNEDKVKIDIEDIDIYSHMSDIKMQLTQQFKDEKKLYDNKGLPFAVIAAIFALMSGFIAMFFAGAGPDSGMAFAALVLLFSSLIILAGVAFTSYKWNYKSKTKKFIGILLTTVFASVSIMGMYFVTLQFSLVGPVLPILVFVAAASGVSIAVFSGGYTPYMASLQGKILGFHQFIVEVEKEKLEQLVKESPQYFFDILPFAYVFGITDEWIKKFEVINTVQNVQTLQAMPIYRSIWIAQRMRYNIQQSQIKEFSTPSSTGAGSRNFSSGGFSGGGFGGGGGRSW